MTDGDDDRLLQAYLDRSLSPGETFQLEQRFCQEPELAERMIQFASDDAVLSEWAANQELDLGELLSQDQSPSTNQENAPDFRSRRRMIVTAFLSGCSLLLLVVGLFYLVPQFQAPAPEAVVFSSGELVQSHIKQMLAEGSAELHFPTGARVLISAPASYEVTGNNSIHLEQGKFIANVPNTGIGFQVDTPHGRVIDLGTLFSVQTADAEDTRVQVYRGKVIASVVDGEGVVKTSRQVEENQSAKIDYQKNEISETLDSHEVSARYGIKRYSSSIIFQEEMPEALATGKYQVFEHDDLAFVFPERSEVVLPQDLNVLVSPTQEEQHSGKKLNYPVSIPAQTKVDCFRVYYDPAIKKGTFIPVRGEIEFERPILGVILEIKELNRTDCFFHPLNEKHPDGSIVHQGTEVDRGIIDPKARYDEVTISDDRKTLSFVLLSGERFVDEFRVIVKSPENPTQK
tara:strand:+ start:17290 stop:18663 length:1374 start_codon:yes stop_codon:yes gene_type:complete